MDKGEDTQEVYAFKSEILGVDSADFLMEDATFIRIQVMVRGRIKKVPTDLIENVAKLIREYELNKKVV